MAQPQTLKRRRTKPAPLPPIDMADPVVAARAAGLRYLTDAKPGIRRVRAGRGFRYIAPDGEPVRDAKELARFKRLAIPPAWTDVWISPSPRGHIQATGRDARGRKQYRYHERWREVRDETKYGRMIAFAEALPAIREQVDEDLSLPGLLRRKVLATIVRLLDETAIRIGNEEYARENQSYGLTTLRTQHVDVSGSTLRFHFRGKSGKEHEVGVRDRRVARIVRKCQELPGQELFQYIDEDGERHVIDSADVNEYLQDISGQDFTAKDFRTWTGTVAAASSLQQLGEFESDTHAKKNVVQAIKSVAARLGNTPAICRKSYVHPDVLESYMDRSLIESWTRAAGPPPEDGAACLHPDEVATLALLERRQQATQQERAS